MALSASTMVINDNLELWGSGYDYGQLGLGGTLTSFKKIMVLKQEPAKYTDWGKVDVAARHAIGIKKDGTLWACGSSADGETGLGTDVTRFTQVGTDADWVDASCARNITAAVKEDGTLWVTGRMAGGPTLVNGKTLVREFTQVGVERDWKLVKVASFVSGSSYHVFLMALKTDGTLWGWGVNASGQLGLGHTDPVSDLPVQIGNESDWNGISLGAKHSIARKRDGTAYGAGNNQYGQIGRDSNELINHTFKPVAGDSKWSQIECGEEYTLLLDYKNIVSAIGRNNYGQFGDGKTDSTTPANTPVRAFTTLFDVTKIMAGSGHSVVITRNKEVYSAGLNNGGQLSSGDELNKSTPVKESNGFTNWRTLFGMRPQEPPVLNFLKKTYPDLSFTLSSEGTIPLMKVYINDVAVDEFPQVTTTPGELVTLDYRIDGNLLTEGPNTISFSISDNLGDVTEVVLTATKTGESIPLKTVDVRFTLIATDYVVAWLRRSAELDVTGALSIVDAEDAEEFVEMNKNLDSYGSPNGALPVDEQTEEDQFDGGGFTRKKKVTLRFTLTREDATKDLSLSRLLGGLG